MQNELVTAIDERLDAHFNVVKNSELFHGFYPDHLTALDCPVLEKEALRGILDTRFDLHAQTSGVYLVRSGGSTNKPLIFPVDIKENLHQRELLGAALLRFGIFNQHTVALNLFSYCELYRSAAILDDILERCNVTTIPVSSKAKVEAMYQLCEQFKPTILMGTPSVLALFAGYLRDNDLSVNVPHVLYAGEYLLPSQAALFAEVFNTQQIYTVYGSAESGIWGWGTYQEDRTDLQVLNDVVVEIDSPNESGYGRVVVTNLLRKRFPVFRYVMGDVGKVTEQNGARMLSIVSREEKSFAVEACSYYLSEFEGLYQWVDRFQIVLSLLSPQQTEVAFLVSIANVSPEGEQKIVAQIQQYVAQVLDMDPKYLVLNIRVVKETEYQQNPTTSKTPLIVDLRT